MLSIECRLASFLDMIALALSGCSELKCCRLQCKCPFQKVLRPLSPSVNDTEEAIALKRSGEHIKGASTIFVVGNGLQTPPQWKLFWAISDDTLHKLDKQVWKMGSVHMWCPCRCTMPNVCPLLAMCLIRPDWASMVALCLSCDQCPAQTVRVWSPPKRAMSANTDKVSRSQG